MFPRARLSIAAALLALIAGGCGRRSSPPVTAHWLVSQAAPTFDPDGPSDPTRWALQRLLSRGLLDQDSIGRIVPAGAERFTVSADRLTCTLVLRRDLVFTDGTPCTSTDFRAAISAGLNRTDHSTKLWLLRAVRGMDAVRAGRPLPALGIETPDAHTLVLRLARPDPRLPRKLALPGVATPWKSRAIGEPWTKVVGVGPYRVAYAEPGRRLVLVRAPRSALARSIAGPDTIAMRFVIGEARFRAALRGSSPDLVWPIPPALLGEDMVGGFRATERAAVPVRRLLLVMRADVPPTTGLPARHALAHGLNRSELQASLGRAALEPAPWLAGADPFTYPRLDAAEVAQWLERGKLGRSFHITLSFDADGAGGAVAREMQGAWSRLNVYAELKPLRGSAASREALVGQSQALLVESQALMPGPEAELAMLVMPLRGPAVGSFRTGWRTREFDPWIAEPRAGTGPFPAAAAQARLEEELVALPLVRLPWRWLGRPGGSEVRFHPQFGPELTSRVTSQPKVR